VAAGILAYIVLTRSSNTAPEFSAAAFTKTVAEGTLTTTTVVAAAATDAEKDTITYSLSGKDASHFSVDASGNITFTSVPNFDAPGDSGFDNVYNFSVTATDDHGKASSSTVAVTVSSAADTETADADGTVTGTANNDDIDATATIANASDLGGGNDFLKISAGGIATTIKVDMNAGNDYLQLTGGTIALDAVVDLGAGNDQFEIDVDTGTSNFIIEMGTGVNVIDIDAVQGAKVITVKDFSSDDIIDVDDWGTAAVTGDFTYDSTAYANLAALQGATVNDSYAYFYDSGTGHTHVIFDDGGVKVEFKLESYSGFSAADLVL
jgi:hypothetical protein